MKNNLHLRGLGKVYGFTLKQMLKSKANIVLMVILILFSLASGPVLMLIGGGFGGSSPKSPNAPGGTDKAVLSDRQFVIENKTSLDLGGLEKNAEKEGYKLVLAETEKKYDEDAIWLCLAEKDGQTELSPKEKPSGETDSGDVLAACENIAEIIHKTELEAVGITEEKLEEFYKGAEYSVFEAAEDTDEEDFSDAAYMVQIMYAVLVMMISMLSANFIIRSVLEEKTSKLVETMTISVDPLAMIFGKVLASVTYTFIQLATVLLCAALSNKVMSSFGKSQAASDMLGGMLSQFKNIGLPAAIVLVVTVLLGCVTFGLLSGLSGVGCSNIEDSGAANSTSMLIVMICYFISIVVALADVPAFVKLIPFLTIFVIPSQFILGKIGIVLVLVSWIIDVLVIALLSVLCASVYKELLLYKGERYKFGKILKLAVDNLKKSEKEVK